MITENGISLQKLFPVSEIYHIDCSIDSKMSLKMLETGGGVVRANTTSRRT
jgi:hypothetical protein